MTTTHALLGDFFECLADLDHSIDRCVDLFAEDGVFEFPYLPAIGLPGKFEGKDAIRTVLKLVQSQVSSFSVSHIVIHDLKDPSALFVEYHTEGQTKGTGRLYAQDYVSHLVVSDGKIRLMREYLNVIASARAMLPNGLVDVPVLDN
jgi:ketosteroid isomerase-like protein